MMNDDFREYVERYCRSRKCTFEEALQHKIVQEVQKHLVTVQAQSKHSPR